MKRFDNSPLLSTKTPAIAGLLFTERRVKVAIWACMQSVSRLWE